MLLNPITFTKGKIIVQFRCKPFAYGKDGDITGTSESSSHSLDLVGDVMQNLNLSFVKSATEAIVKTNADSLIIPSNITGNIIIDGTKLEVMANGNVVTRLTQGVFPKIRMGENSISISNVSSFNYSYTPRYFL